MSVVTLDYNDLVADVDLSEQIEKVSHCFVSVLCYYRMLAVLQPAWLCTYKYIYIVSVT
jgi:hypothetical protein